MAWAFVVSLPVMYVNSRTHNTPPLGGFDYVGFILGFSGIVIQIFADIQKHNFRKDPSNRGKFCQVGLWKYSRHPNYYGEILIWVGAFLVAIPVISGGDGQIAAGAVTVLSPIFTVLILVFLSGMPTSEGQYLERFYKNGQGDAWEEYTHDTPPIVMLPKGVYKHLPAALQTGCCCEFAFLRYRGEGGGAGNGDDEDDGSKGVKPGMGTAAKSLEPGLEDVSSFGDAEAAATSSEVFMSNGIALA